MQSNSLIICALLIAAATAFTGSDPTESVVPEQFYTTEQSSPEYQHAQALVAAHLKQAEKEGKSAEDANKGCAKLADEAEASVNFNVNAEQAILNGLPNGEECLKAGDNFVTTANKNKEAADAKAKAAAEELAEESSKKVHFGDMKYSDIDSTKCVSQFFNSANYKLQKEIVEGKKLAKTKADGAVDEAEKEIKTAANDKKDAVANCRCDVVKNHEDKLKAALEKSKDANMKAWKQAILIRCVLEHKPESQCPITDPPTVKAPTLHEGTEAGCSNGKFNIANSRQAMKNKGFVECYHAGMKSNTYIHTVWSHCYKKYGASKSTQFAVSCSNNKDHYWTSASGTFADMFKVVKPGHGVGGQKEYKFSGNVGWYNTGNSKKTWGYMGINQAKTYQAAKINGVTQISCNIQGHNSFEGFSTGSYLQGGTFKCGTQKSKPTYSNSWAIRFWVKPNNE